MFYRTLTVYPKGDSEADDEFCKYLHLADGEVLSPGEMISVRAQLRALDPRGSKHKTVWRKSKTIDITIFTMLMSYLDG